MKRLTLALALVELSAACAAPSPTASAPVAAPAAASSGAPVAAPDVRLQATPLESGRPIEREIAGGDVHRYAVHVDAGQVLLGTIDQRGVDVVLTLRDPRGEKIRDVDSPNGNKGPEPVVFEATTTGTYYIEVKAFEAPADPGAPPMPRSKAPLGKYEAKIDERVTTAAYRTRMIRAALASPRVFRLWQDAQAGRADAVEDFFAELKAKGAPLVEEIPSAGAADAGQVLVTFALRVDPKQPYVGLLGAPFALETPMAKVPGVAVWYATMKLPRRARFTYSFVGGPPDAMDPLRAHATRFDGMFPDPSGKRALGAGSLVALPDAPPQPWIERRPGVPAGAVRVVKVASARLHQERVVGVYTPAGFDERRVYPLIVAFDGDVYGIDPSAALVPLPTILDNLIAEKKIPPVVAALVAQQGNREKELGGSEPFTDFIALELVPKLRHDFHAGMTPRETVVTGSSAGGVCSAFVGLRHPEVVGNVLSQSGSFGFPVEQAESDTTLLTDRGPILRAFAASKRLPLRFYLEAGVMETGLYGGILGWNRHLRDVLVAKGYPLTYAEFDGNHDYDVWRGTISDGLIALLGPR